MAQDDESFILIYGEGGDPLEKRYFEIKFEYSEKEKKGIMEIHGEDNLYVKFEKNELII